MKHTQLSPISDLSGNFYLLITTFCSMPLKRCILDIKFCESVLLTIQYLHICTFRKFLKLPKPARLLIFFFKIVKNLLKRGSNFNHFTEGPPN